MDGFAYNWHSKINSCYSSVDHSSMNSKSYVCMAVPLVVLGCYHSFHNTKSSNHNYV